MTPAEDDRVTQREPTAKRPALIRERLERAGSWARQNVPFAEIGIDAMERDRRAAAGLIAGGLAYRLFLWLVPLGLVISGGLGFWVDTDTKGMEEAAREFGLSAVAAQSATEAVQGESGRRWYYLLVGIALVVWFGAGVVRALRIAYAVPLGTPPGRLRRPLLAGACFTGLVVAAFAVSLATQWLRESVGPIGILLTLALIVPFAAAGAWAMSLLPHRAGHWSRLLPGAVIVAVGVQVLQLVVALYLAPKLGRSTQLYGTLGAATVVLLWLYIIARLVVAGAFLNAALAERHAPREGATP
jgi:uncharacterized BrkB/YihY/UPF0761 family membrane protein